MVLFELPKHGINNDYRIAGNFRGCTFSRDMAQEALRRNFRGCNIRVSMPRKPHPPQALHVKYRCVGVFNFRVYCSALEKRENLHHTKISRYTVCVSVFFILLLLCTSLLPPGLGDKGYPIMERNFRYLLSTRLPGCQGPQLLYAAGC